MPKKRATVDAPRFALLHAVATVAEETGVPWVVTGAGGRILLLEEVCGLPQGRATVDVDFGVMVDSWEHFRRLEAGICALPGFSSDPKQRQRILHEQGGYLDLIPFGKVENEKGELAWPPDGDFVLNVAGFSDAIESAQAVEVNGSVEVPVISAEGLVLLKLFAWHDRHLTHPKKDAADIAYVLLNYPELVGEPALFEDHFQAMEDADYDLQLAAARVLGTRMAGMSSAGSQERVLQLLARELDAEVDADLVREISAVLVPPDVSRALGLIRALHRGLEGGSPEFEKEKDKTP